MKSKNFNTGIFKNTLSELDSEHDTLLYQTEVVRWLSTGNMLKRLYEQNKKNEKNSELLKYIL